MKILILGNGKTGSFKIRGYQIGDAIGAAVVGSKSERDGIVLKEFDLIIVVKNVTELNLKLIRKSGVPWVYDILDSWPQPKGNRWEFNQSIAWLNSHLSKLRPDAIVFPTEQMEDDYKSHLVKLVPSIALPHHAWSKYVNRNHVPRKTGSIVVGYEGANYLGSWRKKIKQQCKSRGWGFVENGDMTKVDIGIALRDDIGYPARNWKSNCKLANIQALGIPAICSPEAGYLETRCGSELFVESGSDLECEFDWFSDEETRKDAGLKMSESTIRIEEISARYLKWLKGLA